MGREGAWTTGMMLELENGMATATAPAVASRVLFALCDSVCVEITSLVHEQRSIRVHHVEVVLPALVRPARSADDEDTAFLFQGHTAREAKEKDKMPDML